MSFPRYDFHMHTKYLGCANGTMEVADIVRECERIGVEVLAITDHINQVEQAPLHLPIAEDIAALDTDLEVYFGVELNYTGCGEPFPYSEEIRDTYGFQFAIGGIHGTYLQEYDPKKLIEIQHAHHLRTCQDPLVAVLVHPYWFGQGDFKEHGWPWADWLRHIPESCARELGQVARETGTVIEINACANLTNPLYPPDFVKQYAEYLAIVASEGPLFTVGSDAHDINRLKDIEAAWRMVDELGLENERIWRPTMPPKNAA